MADLVERRGRMRSLTVGLVTVTMWAALVNGADAQTSAPRGGAFIVVPHPAGDVYVPLDPSGRPLFPAVPPPTPGAPPTPPSPALPTPEGGGYFVVPPATRDPAPPATGGGYHVVPRPF
jgi:hypothetical protein